MLDDFDVKIMDAVQDNSRQTAEALSEHVGLSAPACQRRLKKLRDDGFIDKEIAIVSSKAAGGFMTFVVQVVLCCHGPSNTDAFIKRMNQIPEVQQCFYVTGEYDFILIVVARDMDDYQGVMGRIFTGDEAVDRYTTTVSMRTTKQSLRLPLG